MELRDAISEAVKWGVEEGVLSAFLERHGSEVQNMLFTEFNIDIAKEVWQEEAREDARNERAVEIARVMLADKESIEKIIRYTSLTREEVERLRATN